MKTDLTTTEEVATKPMTTKTAAQLIKLLSDDLDAWLEYLEWRSVREGTPSEQDLFIEFQWSLALVKEARAFLNQPAP